MPRQLGDSARNSSRGTASTPSTSWDALASKKDHDPAGAPVRAAGERRQAAQHPPVHPSARLDLDPPYLTPDLKHKIHFGAASGCSTERAPPQARALPVCGSSSEICTASSRAGTRWTCLLRDIRRPRPHHQAGARCPTAGWRVGWVLEFGVMPLVTSMCSTARRHSSNFWLTEPSVRVPKGECSRQAASPLMWTHRASPTA